MSDSAPSTPYTTLLTGHDPHRLAAMVLAGEPPTDPTATDQPWTTFGGIDLYEEIGRGGMGVVYRARQRALERDVAIKVLLRAQFASREERERFFREAQAAARLQHPGIVAVHEVGEDEGVPWFSMDHIPGRSLEQIVREHPMSARSAAECVQKVAAAIHHAHENGVLHRDLKPSNILMDAEGEPRITDFGIARIASEETTTNRQAELTLTGQSLGSPGYAAPEQALHGKADARTDVYGLGALLYHLLTGRPPFQGPTLDSILVQLRENDPLSPRRLNPSVPRDLETICLKCLPKSPEARYSTARDVADDLECFLDGRLILAHPPSPLGKAWRWTRRHPGIAAMFAIIALLILAIIGGSLAFARHQQFQEKRAALIGEARRHRTEISAGSRARALAALRQAWDIQPSSTIRDEAIAALAMHDMHLEETLQPDHPLYKPPASGGSADGLFAMRFEAGRVIVFEVKTGREHATLAGFKKAPRAQLDDRARRIAIVPETDLWQPCEVTLHDLPSGKKLQTLLHPHAVRCLDWSGEMLVTGGSIDRLVYVWDTHNGERLHRFSGHDSEIEAVTFRRDGQEIVSLAADGRAHVWHAGTGREVLRLEPSGMHGAPAWWSADGSRLYIQRKNAPQVDVLRFEWSNAAQLLTPGRDEPRSENIPSIHASSDGLTATAVDETGCHVWDWRHGRQAGFISKDGGEWMAAQLGQNDALWISSWNQPLRLRPLLRDAAGWLDVPPHQPSVLDSGPLVVALRADGLALASTQDTGDNSDDHILLWWPREQSHLRLPQPDPYCAALSPDGRWCVTGSFNAHHEALLWSLPDGKLARKLPHLGLVGGLVFVQNGSRLWIWGNETLQCLDTATWKPVHPPWLGTTQAFAVSPDGTRAARVTAGKVALLRTTDLSETALLPMTGATSSNTSLVFSGDSRHVFIHSSDGAVQRWDLQAINSELEKLGITP
jgi:WD40 repeat protein/tRNA A-37 threonylcarbamoyl transferase component Bud32